MPQDRDPDTRDIESNTPRASLERAAQVKAHVERHIGRVRRVFSEPATQPVRIEVLQAEATKERPFHTLITSGMSDLPMRVPQEMEAPRHLELGITLPEYWQLDEEAMQDTVWRWPLQQLRELACFPHRNAGWLGWGHVVPHGNPPQPLASDTQLCGAIVAPSLLVPKDFYELELGTHSIVFYSVVPLYAEEMQLVQREGMEPLLKKLIDRGIRDLVNPHRKNVALKKRFGLFGR